ncbi:Acetyltransferase (GNAT) family protein [Paraoerskovia marina]|uniref:Acetyltransferase (GNAT) family protein n=1 Tax=Paraoerskovia marina TaxID=545619 RepID=A0A1H1PLL4_9CELL|nr:GNAT family N-acetyltransferase [Paraoerskovia marina]SDS12046.1 Acetyltransferase (GNAT) family protein [Paraoerskovia marina]
MTIRPARASDPSEVDALYDICLRTGADGQDATGRFEDPRLLGEVYLGAYLALEPSLAFVVTSEDDRPLGYVLGVPDTTSFEERLDSEWWPALRERYPLDGVSPDSPDAGLVRQIHAPHRTEAPWLADYPAHLHVDLLPEAQGGGNGRRLLEELFDALRDHGIPGVHLGVSDTNTSAIGFYRHLGFEPLPAGSTVLGLTLD